MTDHHVVPPPSGLLDANIGPQARTLIAEVRSDASLDFDPTAAPGYLVLNNVAFGALIQWRVDVSWSRAERIQDWLTGPPAGIPGVANREEALKNFFENLRTGAPPQPFLEYVGTYLATGISNASYTLVLGIREAVAREAYRSAFQTGLTTVQAGPPPWPGELVSFFKMMLDEPTSREEFLVLASNVGVLSAHASPLIKTILP